MSQINQKYLSILQKNMAYYGSYKRCIKKLEADGDLYLAAFAPVLVEYVKWVLFKAREDGKKRLYFLARDGWQMYIAAKRLVEIYKLDIDCRYLKVSRYAMRVPEYHLLGARCVERICVGGIDVTFEKIMARAGLSYGQALAVARQCGYENKLKQVISYQEVMSLKSVLADNSDFLKFVDEQSRMAYPTAIGYLLQEGLMEEVDFAIVDSGWIGTLSESIKNLCKSALTPQKAKDFKVDGYFFGLYDYPHGHKTTSYQSFYFGKKDNIRRKVYFSNSLFEAVFSAPEGMTHHYEEHDGRFEPVLDMNNNPNYDRIKQYGEKLEMLIENIKTFDEKCDMKLVEKLLISFMAKPGKAELEEFGNILFSDDVLENNMQKVSADLSQEEIKKQRFTSKLLISAGLKKDVIHESAWIEGSIVKNGIAVKSNLKHAALCKYVIYLRKCWK